MAQRFDNQSRRTLIFLVILLDLVVIQKIDGYPSNKSALIGKSKFYRRSLVDELKNGPVPSCEGKTFCVDVPSYPYDYVASVLSMDKSLKKLATVDLPTGISERMDFTEDGEALCSSEEVVFRPQTALGINNRWLYVVNTDECAQKILFESCVSDGSPCNIIDKFNDGYKTTCRQTYVYRQLLAINSNGAIGNYYFRIPATCKCYVKFTGDPYSRMGVSLGKGKHPQSPISKKKN